MRRVLPNFAGILNSLIFKPVLRPVIRVLGGLLAIPVFRFLIRRVFRVHASDAELERDLENWFRGSIILLAATKNFEDFVFGLLDWGTEQTIVWQSLLLRLLLAVGVIESMPDEDVFSVVHRGPPKLKLTTRAGWGAAWRARYEVLRGLGILHLRRSSPVFVIMAVVGVGAGTTENVVGWCCYGLAVAQYLVIAVITQRDRLTGLLENFDRNAQAIRDGIVEKSTCAAPIPNLPPHHRPGRFD